jgi:DnaJ-class molecular chaperone
LQVLDLTKGVSQEEIRSRYRELSKKWHPDKFLDEDEKEEAHVRSVYSVQSCFLY